MIKLLKGDCLELMKGIPDGSIDMILTDPPYGMDYQSNRRVKTEKFRKMENDETLKWLDDFATQSFRVMKENTSAYIFCSWHNVDLFKQAFQQKFKIKNIIVWVKNNHGSGDLKGAYAPKHEFIIFMHKGRSLFRGKRVPDVVNIDKVTPSKMTHPTEKPIGINELFIKNNSDENSVILDPFMGSGSTGVAAKNLNRDFIGIELDEEYFKIAEKRING